MSLEANLAANTEAMKELTTTLKAAMAAGVVPTPGKAAAAPAADTTKAPKASKAPKGPSAEDVRAAATAYAKQHGKPAAKALIAKHGGADLASLPEANWTAFVAATKEAPEPEADEDEDDGL